MSISLLDNDFNFYLRFAKPLVLNLSEPDDRVLAAAWIQKLRDENVGNLRLRTDYLKLLLFVLQRKKLIGTFAENPNNFEKLDEFPDYKLQDVAKEFLLSEDDAYHNQKSSGDNPPYSTEHSADLLEYSAAQDIPNFGVHAYYAISNEPLTNWNRTEKAVFPRTAISATDKFGNRTTGSNKITSSSEPFLDGTNTGRPESYSSKGKRPLSRSPRAQSSKPLKVSTPVGERSPPTWGSNLIGVTEPPLRETPAYTPQLDDDEEEDIFDAKLQSPMSCHDDGILSETPPSFMGAPSPPPLSPGYDYTPSWPNKTPTLECQPCNIDNYENIDTDFEAFDRMIAEYENDDGIFSETPPSFIGAPSPPPLSSTLPGYDYTPSWPNRTPASECQPCHIAENQTTCRDFEAFDRMIGEYEKDDGTPPLSPIMPEYDQTPSWPNATPEFEDTPSWPVRTPSPDMIQQKSAAQNIPDNFVICPAKRAIPKPCKIPGPSSSKSSKTSIDRASQKLTSDCSKIPLCKIKRAQATKPSSFPSPEFLLPEGEEPIDIFMETPPSFLDDSTLPSLDIMDIADLTLASLPYLTHKRDIIQDHEPDLLTKLNLDQISSSENILTSEDDVSEADDINEPLVDEIQDTTPDHLEVKSPIVYPSSPAAQDIIDEFNRQHIELAQRQPKTQLEKDYELYLERCKQRRPDVPQTPPVFSKYRSLMGREADRIYDPSEFGEISGIEWQPAEEFFQNKTKLSPREDMRGSGFKRTFPGMDIGTDDLLLDEDSFLELVNIEDEYDQTTVSERSPVATQEDFAKQINDAQSDINRYRKTSPALCGLAVTTPRPSPSPRRPQSKIQIEDGDSEISFELPDYQSPDGSSPKDQLFFESPPSNYYYSPGSPQHSTSPYDFPDPFGLPKPFVSSQGKSARTPLQQQPEPSSNTCAPCNERSSIKRKLFTDAPLEDAVFLEQIQAADIKWNKKPKKVKAVFPPMDVLMESPIRIPGMLEAEDTTGFRKEREKFEEKFTNLPQPFQEQPYDLIGTSGHVTFQRPYSELDRSLPKELPTPLKPFETNVPGWESPKHLKIRKKSPKISQLPQLAENVRIPARIRNVISQEPPPADIMFSPKEISPQSLAAFKKELPRQYQISPPYDILEAISGHALEDELEPEDMYFSPKLSPKLSPRSSPRSQRLPESPISSPESPPALRMRLLQADEPKYYSKDQMRVYIKKPHIVRYKAPPPTSLKKIQELKEEYPEEQAKFLAKVESASGKWKKERKKIKITTSELESLRESPIKVPHMFEVEDATGFRKIREELEKRYANIPESYQKYPEDLLGSSTSTHHEQPVSELDRSLPKELPPPLQPPTILHGWKSPPHLQIPKRAYKSPKLPKTFRRAEHLKLPPSLRNVINQEIPPSDLNYSPPPLSPTSLQAMKTTFTKQPSPKLSPKTKQFALEDIYKNVLNEGIDMEVAPEEMHLTTPTRPPRTQEQSPLSPPESPFALKIRLLQEPEPEYYCKDDMTVFIKKPYKVRYRTKPKSSLHVIRELRENCPPEHAQFLSEVDSASGKWKIKHKRIKMTPSQFERIMESPVEVPGILGVDDPTGFRKTREELEAQYKDLPELTQQNLPENLYGTSGKIAYHEPRFELDKPLPRNLPSPIKPPTVLPGWSTPPRLQKHVKVQSPYKFKLKPSLRDIIFYEAPPADLAYSPPQSPPEPITKPSPILTPRSPRTPPRTYERMLRHFDKSPQFLESEPPPMEMGFSPPYVYPDDLRPSPLLTPRPPRSPRTPPRTFKQMLEDFGGSPQLLDSELPPLEMASYSPYAYPSDSRPSPLLTPKSPKTPPRTYKQMLKDFEKEPQLLEAETPPEFIFGKSPAELTASPITSQHKLTDSQKQAAHAITKEALKQLQEAFDKALETSPVYEKGGAQYYTNVQPSLKHSPIDKQIKELYKSSAMKHIAEIIKDIPDVNVPQRKPAFSPKYGETSPRWSPKLPHQGDYPEQIDLETMPEEVYGYSSPKTPPKSPSSKIQMRNIFDENIAEEDIEFLDTIQPPDELILRSPTTPPRINDFYEIRSPTQTPESPVNLSQLVEEHKFTKHYYDKDRNLMTKRVFIKNKMRPLSSSKRPKVSSIEEAYIEEGPFTPPRADLIRLSPSDKSEKRIITETIAKRLSSPTLMDSAIPHVHLPSGIADPQLDFKSPPRPQRPKKPEPFVYVPGPKYKDELMFTSPPQLYKSPERDIFEEIDEHENLLETTPPAEYDYSTPSESSSEEEELLSPYYGFTPPPPSPKRLPPPVSPIDSPSFLQSIQEHEYTDQFFHKTRPKATNIVKIGNKAFRLRRRAPPPKLDNIQEIRVSPDYRLPKPIYYGSPGREYIRTPIKRVTTSSPKQATISPLKQTMEPLPIQKITSPTSRTMPSPKRQATLSPIQRVLLTEEFEDPWDNRIPFSNQDSPDILDTSFIEALDNSFIEEDLSGFKWMG